MEEEEEWDKGPSMEEVISSVLKSKSKFGKVKLSLPPLTSRRVSHQMKDATNCNDHMQAKTEELHSLLHYKEKGSSDTGVRAQLNVKDIHPKVYSGRVSPQNRERFDPSNYGLHRISMSSSKILRSTSTPEMRPKTCTKAPNTVALANSAKPIASRQMDFSEIPQIGHFDKENTNPFVGNETFEGKYSSTLESVLKSQQPKTLERSKATEDIKLNSQIPDDYNLRETKGTITQPQEVSNTGDTIKRLMEREFMLENKQVSVMQKQVNDHDNGTYVGNFDQKNLVHKSSSTAKCVQVANQKPSVPFSCLPSHTKLSPDSSTDCSGYKISASQKMCVTSAAAAKPPPAVTSSEISLRTKVQPVREMQTGLQRSVTTGKTQIGTSSMTSRQPSGATVPQYTLASSQSSSHATHMNHTRVSDGEKPLLVPKVSQSSLLPPQGTSSSSKNTPSSNGEMKLKETTVTNKIQPGQFQTQHASTGLEMRPKMTPVINRTSTGQFQTPSNQRLQAMPPTPPTKQKFQHMENIVVNDQEYLKLGLVGRGGSSKVYEVLDLETRKVKAIKVVELEGVDEDTLHSYKNEIDILTRLQWSDKVIQLYDYELSDIHLKLIMEKGNRDLASILNSARGRNAKPISPFTIQHYWQGMLLAVQAIHQEGIIHSDLKPANFLLVNETVKLIDFGIASSIQQDMTSVIKDSQAGTFNYMSPESLMDVHSGPIINGRSGDRPTIKIGVKSDVWSLGCILYNLVYGCTPFQHISNPLQKLSAIADPNTKINFPDLENKLLLEVLQLCLQFDPRKRPTISQLLEHAYLTAKPGGKGDKKTPQEKPQLKSMMNQLAQLTPNSLNKITSMMQQMQESESKS